MKEVLREVFGFENLRAGQEEVVSFLMEGRSALAIFPTGGGKSLCYQLPALLLEGTALVISPLLALMKDQVDRLVAKGVVAARLDSSLEKREYAEVVGRLTRGELKLLYVSPEKLCSGDFWKLLKGVEISLIAVDEAHCISEWGHSFRPDYLKVAGACRKLRVKRVLALTATATPKVEADIRRSFRIAKADVVKLSFHRENLDLRVTACVAVERKAILWEKLAGCDGAAIVYVTRQERAEEVATFLAAKGLRARAYHAGLRGELRREIQEEFMAGEVDVVVATIAFGMGVDKADIRAVFHYNLPKSLEGYTQEIGRAGRDGRAAVCEMLACADDLTVLENFIFSDTPSEKAVRNLLERVLRQSEKFDVSVYELATSCDIRQTVVETIFTYLELEGVVEAGVKFFENYRVKLLRPMSKVLAGRGTKEKKLLKKIFEGLDEEWKWLLVETTALGGEPVRKLLEELEAGGEVVLKKAGWRQVYRLKKKVEVKPYAEEMAKQFQLKEARELQRLDQVVALAKGSGCMTARILRHFGEKLVGACGHCDRCRGVPAVKLVRRKVRKVSDAELEKVQAVIGEKYASLGTTRQLARFLCGMSSPASMRARLYRHDAYGMFADMPFHEVEILAGSWF
jgi:ATP-dependent DNA helicase RecQ